MGNLYQYYKENAKRCEQKESFDNFFQDASVYLKLRWDNEFNVEVHKIMDEIWIEQISKPSQFYVSD